MTMIQVVVQPTRVWVAADSVCTRGDYILRGDDGLVYEVHKLIVLPLFVLTSLGSLELSNHAQAVAKTLACIDEAIDRMPQILRGAYQALRLREHDAENTRFVGHIGHTILCLGWSESLGHMLCVAFASGNDFEPELHGSGKQGSTVFWRNPDIPREPFSCYPDDRESLVANSFATVQHWRGMNPQTPIGGALRLAEITRESIVVSVAGDLGQPATNEGTEQPMQPKTLASFMVAAALSACGGSDDVEVTANQLEPNAATSANATNATSTLTLSNTNGTTPQELLSITFVATGGMVQIEYAARVSITLPSGTLNKAIYVGKGAVSTLNVLAQNADRFTYSTTNNEHSHTGICYDQPAAGSVTYWLGSIPLAPGESGSVYERVLRVTEIKR